MAKYGELTQGSIINNLRIQEYPDTPFFGIIITARCDIANCKVSKFYYLFAASVDSWVRTEGVRLAARKVFEKKLNKILQKWENKLPDFLNIVHLPLVKIQEAIKLARSGDGDDVHEFNDNVEQTLLELDALSKYCHSIYPKGLADELLKEKEIRDNVKTTLELIISDRDTHYCFVPFSSYKIKDELEKAKLYEGLIVNLLDIAWFDYDTAEKIEKQELDFNLLDKKSLEEYNRDFYLEQPEDIIFPENSISSPYVEWLMQHFSQAFIRIGVDKPPHKDISNYYCKQLGL